MNNIVLAIVGVAGTGKSALTALMSAVYSFTPVYFGGCVLEEVKRRGLDLSSENERSIREELRAERGMHVIAELSHPSIQAALTDGFNVVIDGLYSRSEYEYLKARLTNEFFLLAVHSAKRLRYERLANRDHRSLSALEVDTRDSSELKNLEKCEPIVLADYHIVNDGTHNELSKKLDEIMREVIPRD